MNRIDRVCAILIHLQSKKLVKAKDIADRFNISLRTVYRDVKTLEEAGVPIIGEAGSGYSIMEGYRLPPVMFTKDEAAAFITAGKLVEKLTDKITEAHYQSALFKLKAVLRSAEKEHVEGIEEHIEVLDNPYLPQGIKTSKNIPLILECIANKTVLRIHYFANHSQEASWRDVEPVGIFYLGNWYLIAFCRLRNDYRHFRLDRVNEMICTDIHFEGQHPSLKEFIDQLGKREEVYTVIMQVDKDAVPHLGDQKFYNGYVSEQDLGGKIEMTFLTASLTGFARWYIMFADKAEIIGPQSLKEHIHELVCTISKKLNKETALTL